MNPAPSQPLDVNERTFRVLIDHASDGIALVHPERGMTFASPAARRLFGVGLEAPLEVDPNASTHPEDLPMVLAALEELLREPGQVRTLQYRFRHVDGTWLWIESVFSNLLGVPGIDAIVINFRNIQDRREAQSALRESESRFSRVFHASPVGMSISTLEEGRYLDVNAELLRIFGVSREEMIGRTALELGLWADPGQRADMVSTLRRQGAVRDVELKICTRRHGVRHVLWSGERLVFEGELCLLGSAIDITVRWEAAEALRRSEERFRTLVESAPEAVFIQTGGRFAYLNAAALRLFGATRPEELVGQPVIDRFHPNFQAQVRERIRLLNEARLPVPSVDELCLTLAGTRVDVNISATPFTYQDEPGALVFARDVTERKRAEGRLADRLDELRRWRDATLGREARVLQLKHEVNELLAHAGLPPRYSSALPGAVGGAGPAPGFPTAGRGAGAP